MDHLAALRAPVNLVKPINFRICLFVCLFIYLLTNILFFICLVFFFPLFIVAQLQLSPFPSITLPCPTHPRLPHSILPAPCCPCPWVLYMCSLMTLPLLCPIIPLPSPLVSVGLFFISMFLVIFCSLVLMIRLHL